MLSVIIRCEGKTTLPLDRLIQFQGKLKSLAKEDYEKFKAQLLDPEIGFCEPITVWPREDGLEYLIANGHQRLRVLDQMRKEGIEIPDIPVSFVYPTSKASFAKIVLSLCSQYGKIEKDGMYEYCSIHQIPVEYIETRLRLPEIDLPKYKEEFFSDHEADEKAGEIPQVKDILVSSGDLWTLGKHRLLCGDSTDLSSLENLMNGDSVDLVFTDPPYNLKFEYNSYDDNKSKDEYALFCAQWFSNIKTVSEKQIISPGTQNLEMWLKMASPKAIGIWIKKNWISGGLVSNLQQWEPILFFGPCERTRGSDLFEINRVYQKDVGEDHTCPKQIELIVDILNHWANGPVLDVFMGSGTTLIACEKTNRSCFGMELDPRYCTVILQRWADFTGLDPIRHDGVSFSELKRSGI